MSGTDDDPLGDENFEEWAEQAVVILKDFYSPAPTMAEANEYFTTNQIISFIQAIHPQLELYSEVMVTVLKKHDFRYELIAPGQLRWLMAEVT